MTSNQFSFGDSTAFPLRENFLDTIMATVRASAALFVCEGELDNAEDVVRKARESSESELLRVEALQQQLIRVLDSAQGPVCAQAAAALRGSTQSILGQTRQQIEGARDHRIRAAVPTNVSGRVHEILSRFWLVHELPRTRWNYQWRVSDDGRARAELRASTRGTTATFIVKPEGEDIWASDISVSDLLPSLSIEIPIWTRRCRGTRTQAEELADYQIIEVESSQTRQRFVLSKRGKAKHALLITLVDSTRQRPTVSLIDEQHDVLGDVHELSVMELEELSKLWNLVQEHRPSLLNARCELGTVTIDNRTTSNIDHPSEIAEALLHSIAPLVKEIRLRSRIPGELILKRDTGKGRREELFVSREQIQAHYKGLPDRHRRVFDAMGLGTENTYELVTLIREQENARQPRMRSQRVVSSTEDAIDILDEVIVSIEAA